MRLLLIWEEIPETTKFFLRENPTEQELAILKAAHGGLINTMDISAKQEAALDFLNAALTDPKYGSNGVEGQAITFLHRWHDKQIAMETLPDLGPIDTVIWAGFCL